MNDPIFRVLDLFKGKYIDEMWKEHPDHLENHLLIGPTGKVFWVQWDGIKEITMDVKLEIVK